jgi:hypothetical protein
MSFSTFLNKMQKMFNIFEEENEPISEQAKVRMLLIKVVHTQLQDAVNAVRFANLCPVAHLRNVQTTSLCRSRSYQTISPPGSYRVPRLIGQKIPNVFAVVVQKVQKSTRSVRASILGLAQMSTDDKQVVLDTRKNSFKN